MTSMLVYSFLPDPGPFPRQVLNPLAYKMETFPDRESALRKARYVTSHSRVHHLAVWDISQALDEPEIRRWIGENPAADLGLASEA